LAAAERMMRNKVGQYGHAAGATSTVPKAAA
jgi:hypothetical protein